MVPPINHFIILGLPIAFFFGFATLISLIVTLTIGALVYKGKYGIPISWHLRMAGLTIVLAIIHVVLVIQQFHLFGL